MSDLLSGSKIDFYKRAITESFSYDEEKVFQVFRKLCPAFKKLKVTSKEIKTYRSRKDLFDLESSEEIVYPDNLIEYDSESPWIDKDFAFQLAHEMDDLKSLKWYERIVDRCDKARAREIILRSRGEVIELDISSGKLKNKGALFARLVRTYSEERGISLGDYKKYLKQDEKKFFKRDIIRRKREKTNKLVEELKMTMNVEELCNYYKRTLLLIKKECGQFFFDHDIAIPQHIINAYMNRIIGQDYNIKLQNNRDKIKE
ncbi:MAG TPA: hypothetical protein PL110_00610 [Candidatus Eremiobacteraeota bacterium]|nr:MAG: hypothetical protein BWY64_00112 [bacterium ADurb.Bin363]HPZ06588.1 hypothetical protein [Candidatus Eremiobacteraeota bacterium]